MKGTDKVSPLGERFRELDRASAYARSLGRDDPSEREAWRVVDQLVGRLHGDPREGRPSWAEHSWDHTDPVDPAVRQVIHDGPRLTIESGTGDPSTDVYASVDATTQPDGSRELARYVMVSAVDSLTPVAARQLAAVLLNAADLVDMDELDGAR